MTPSTSPERLDGQRIAAGEIAPTSRPFALYTDKDWKPELVRALLEIAPLRKRLSSELFDAWSPQIDRHEALQLSVALVLRLLPHVLRAGDQIAGLGGSLNAEKFVRVVLRERILSRFDADVGAVVFVKEPGKQSRFLLRNLSIWNVLGHQARLFAHPAIDKLSHLSSAEHAHHVYLQILRVYGLSLEKITSDTSLMPKEGIPPLKRVLPNGLNAACKDKRKYTSHVKAKRPKVPFTPNLNLSVNSPLQPGEVPTPSTASWRTQSPYHIPKPPGLIQPKRRKISTTLVTPSTTPLPPPPPLPPPSLPQPQTEPDQSSRVDDDHLHMILANVQSLSYTVNENFNHLVNKFESRIRSLEESYMTRIDTIIRENECERQKLHDRIDALEKRILVPTGILSRLALREYIAPMGTPISLDLFGDDSLSPTPISSISHMNDYQLRNDISNSSVPASVSPSLLTTNSSSTTSARTTPTCTTNINNLYTPPLPIPITAHLQSNENPMLAGDIHMSDSSPDNANHWSRYINPHGIVKESMYDQTHNHLS